MSRPAATILLATALLTAACGDEEAGPTSPSPATTSPTTTFIGSLAVGGARFYSFTLSTAGTVSVMLASVTAPSSGAPLARALQIAVGIPAGTGCSATSTQVVTAALTPQLSVSLQPGTFCVSVSDVGDLTGTVNFALRFTHP